MERGAHWYLNYVVDEIHTTVVATVDDEGLPVTAAIEMMAADEGGLYFLTARSKSFYERLAARKYLAFTDMKGVGAMGTVAVSVRGRVEEVGPQALPMLFERNPFMYDIYPTEASRAALTVFKLCEGTGEWFDLSKKPIERASFAFGGAAVKAHGYVVDADACTGCAACAAACPQSCIDFDEGVARIRQENCLHCGNCLEACAFDAVSRV